MVSLLLFVVFVVVLIAIVIGVAGSDRYSKMTEEEFEAEAERSSLLGAAMLATQKLIQPSRAQAMIEQKKRVEKDATAAGGEPPKEKSPTTP